jgi:hypothetical protein
MKKHGFLLVFILLVLVAGLSGCEKITSRMTPEYSLTINPGYGGGHVTLEFGSHTYKSHTEVTVTALPDSGWQFAGWVGDWVSKETSALDPSQPSSWLDTTIVVLMDRDRTITANFSQMK